MSPRLSLKVVMEVVLSCPLLLVLVDRLDFLLLEDDGRDFMETAPCVITAWSISGSRGGSTGSMEATAPGIVAGTVVLFFLPLLLFFFLSDDGRSVSGGAETAPGSAAGGVLRFFFLPLFGFFGERSDDDKAAAAEDMAYKSGSSTSKGSNEATAPG